MGCEDAGSVNSESHHILILVRSYWRRGVRYTIARNQSTIFKVDVGLHTMYASSMSHVMVQMDKH